MTAVLFVLQEGNAKFVEKKNNKKIMVFFWTN